MYCGKCGQNIPDDSNVCQFCGVRVNEGFSPIEKKDEHVSMGQWLGIMAIGFIPCIGGLVYLIMLFIWGFGDTKKKSLKTYARAALIMTAISTVLLTIIYAAFIGFAGGLAAIMEGTSPIYY